MDIVRIKLIKPNTFWFLNDLKLGPTNTLSQPFDLDMASEKVRETIRRGEESLGIIKIVRSSDDVTAAFDINSDSSFRFELQQKMYSSPKRRAEKPIVIPSVSPVSTKSIEMPELKSFTVENNSEAKDPTPTPEDFKSAKILLARNGNTAKKAIRSLNKPVQEKKLFLQACLELESNGKNRVGIIDCIQEAIEEIEE